MQLARHIMPEQPFILTPGPARATGLAARSSPNNLPAQMTSLVGRDLETQAVKHFLEQESIRLLTLVGPPGIGKTRLSMRCGQELLADFPDGVWFIDLSTIREGALVLPSILRAIPAAQAAPTQDARQGIILAIQTKHMLLILDNFEQLVEPGAAELVQILKACPNLKALVTSRLPLQVYGEHEYPVPSLSFPHADTAVSLDSLAQNEAVQLFLVRMHQHTPDFTIDKENAAQIVEICRRMEGIPLALELAAATARRLPLQEITRAIHLGPGQGWLQLFQAQAHDLPARQQTLYAAIAWSYDLLEPAEQAVFRSLGVFSGAIDAQAAMVVCPEIGSDQEHAAAMLEKLADLYLLSPEQENHPPRWRMLEMIREFALETLAQSGLLQDVRRRHAHYFVEKLARLNEITTHDEYDHFSTSNSANLYSALEWSIQAGEVLTALNLASLMEWMWERQGLQREGLKWMQKALVMPTNHLRTGEASAAALDEACVQALFGASNLAWQQRQYDRALAWLQKAIDLARARRVPYHYFLSLLNQLGRIYIQQKQYNLARQALQQCLSLAEVTPELFNPGRPMAQLGEVALAEGKLEEAKSRFSRALELLTKEDHLFQALTRINQAEAAIASGDYRQAAELLQLAFPEAALILGPTLRFCATLAGWLVQAPIEMDEKARRAVELFGAIENLGNLSGYELSLWMKALKDRRLELARSQLSKVSSEQAWSHGWAWKKEQLESQAVEIMEQIRDVLDLAP